MGIAAQHDELERLDAQKVEIEKRERRLLAEQSAIINGTSVEVELEEGGHYSYYHDEVLRNAMNLRTTMHESEILAESELGRRVLSLRAEKENLLDTVWLATSSTQIKQLWEQVWEQVNAMLGVTPRRLRTRP